MIDLDECITWQAHLRNLEKMVDCRSMHEVVGPSWVVLASNFRVLTRLYLTERSFAFV
jgi:hypothetical protein